MIRHVVRFAAWLAGAAVVATTATARAEGYSARPFRLALERRGLATIDGAHPPAAGDVELAVGSDYVHGPLLLTGSNGTQALLSGRWTLEPAVAIGLPSAFALYARAPFAVMDNGVDRTNDLTPTGPFPPVVGGLLPIHRDPRSGGRLSLRGELALPLGDASSFRGDDVTTGRLSLVYGGPVMGAFGLLSGGMILGPTRSVGSVQIGGPTVSAAAALRFPAETPVGAVVAFDSRVETIGARRTLGLGTVGVDVRVGDSTLRASVGLESRFTDEAPNVWVGVAWMQRAPIVPARVVPAAAPREVAAIIR